MNSPRIELRNLAYFIAACQNPTISETARELGIAPSALSVGLHALENDLKIKLFLRRGNYLCPLPSAFWLFEEAVGVLRAEQRLRETSGRPGAPLERLQIHLNLSFTIGLFSKAINRTIAELGHERPDIDVDFRFLSSLVPGSANLEVASPEPANNTALTRIDIAYCPPATEADGQLLQPFYEDGWCAVGLVEPGGKTAYAAAPLIVLEMRGPLIEAVTNYADQHGLRGRLTRMKADPADLARLLAEFPHARFLLPRSMIAGRLGLGRAMAEPLDPPLTNRIGVRIRGQATAAAELFLACLRENLAAPEANTAFAPQLTAKQVHYFNLVHGCGGISAAARMANITQPSISLQIQKMETVLGGALFKRHRGGMTSTAMGRSLLAHTLALDEKLVRILRAANDIAAHTQATVSIGMPPSSGHDSLMTKKIAQALTAVHLSNPACRLRIVEASNAALHDQVRSGQLNLAVVDAVQAQMARVSLGRSERLSLVANPGLDLGGRTEISFDEACALPLVLSAEYLSIHQALVAAAEARHLRIDMVMEVGSLPLAIAMVRKAPICTVLPLSSVKRDVEQGRLTACTITEDVISSSLSVIFSGKRTLSEVERSIIQELVAAFRKAPE
jgi:molybdate transport repressor ModE-like protein